MPDINKVIKGLDCEEYNRCSECPYVKFGKCKVLLMRDVKELLKEQEAVEPTLIREGRNMNYNDYVCPRCDNEVIYEQNYCSECGVRFLWKGGEQDA